MLKSPKELAEELGFSASQIRRLICQGIIKAEKVGSYYAIDTRYLKDIKRRRSPNGIRKSKNVTSEKPE